MLHICCGAYKYSDEGRDSQSSHCNISLSWFCTGAGGEIRDEGATGRGAKPRAGFTGFSVSNLNIPEYIQPWERYWESGKTDSYGKPSRISSALQIMLEGPIGGAEYNNEFGRPNLAGVFPYF